MNLKPTAVLCLLLSLAACTDHDDERTAIPEGTPMTFRAEIARTSDESPETRAENDIATLADIDVETYDRSVFQSGDKISISCYRGEAEKPLVSAAYTLTGDGKWDVPTGSTPLSFLPATSFQTEFPTGYNSILSDQSTAENFLMSNLLRTPKVPVISTTVNFTDGNAFNHENVKLTLKFTHPTETDAPVFTQMSVKGKGLRTGTSEATSTDEAIQMLRPAESELTWHAVIFPKNTATDTNPAPTTIHISVTDANGTTYTADITCGMQAGNHYTYTLNIRNDILVATGEEIKGWASESRYEGGFNK